ncbi:hypothetical protein FBU30_007274 [Linnemannia zychae]|nr:hypothetical protein FBU30_007274 [Linnemannia zychae]
MDTLKQRSKRRSSPRKTPYARPEGSPSHTKEAPSFQTRIMRFLAPWLSDETVNNQDNETDKADNKTLEDTLEDTTLDHHITEAAEAAEDEQDSEHTNNSIDQDESTEIIEESTLVTSTPNEDSQVTMIFSQERNMTPEPDESVGDGSMVDVTEDSSDVARQMEREESLVSGLDSDAGVDRKESRRSTRKRDSRQSTPVRTTRRSTRSQTSKLEEEIIITEETSITSAVLTTTENVVLNELRDESTENTIELPQGSQELSPKGGKKKKKGRRSTKQSKNEPEDLEQEIAQSDARIAEKIQKSQDLIAASEELLKRSEALDETTEQVLKDPKDTLMDKADVEKEEPIQQEEDEDQTFHSTKQFETNEELVEEENDESQEHLYPVLDEDAKFYPDDEEDDQENADTVKYYPESPASTKPIDVDTEDEVQTQSQDAEQERSHEAGQELEQEQDNAKKEESDDYDNITFEPPSRNPSPPAATLSSASPLHEGEEVAFSPMVLSRSPTPTPSSSTPLINERLEECQSDITPKKEHMKLSPSIKDKLPMSNLEFLAEFFKEQGGKPLTREQADRCQQLIEEAVRPFNSSTKQSSLTAVSSSQVSPPSASGHAFPSTKHVAPVQEEISLHGFITTPTHIANKATKRAAPFEIRRQNIGDLYHESKSENSQSLVLPSLDEYLEIKKYEGVDWDDLPNHVKVKRLLEWKGTEAPEVLKRRKIEERRLMREKNAEIWGRDKKDTLAEQDAQSASALKRTATTSGVFSEDEEELAPHHKKPSATSTTASAAVMIAGAKDTKAKDAPKVSSIAQKLLDIVHNDSDNASDTISVTTVEKIADNIAKPASASAQSVDITTAKESASETLKPTFLFGKSDANTTASASASASPFPIGSSTLTKPALEISSSESVFATPATVSTPTTSTATTVAPKPLFGSLPLASTPTSTATSSGFSLSTASSVTKETPKPQFNFGVTTTPSSSSVTTALPITLESSSGNESTKTTTTTTTMTTTTTFGKSSASPFGVTSNFTFGNNKSPSAAQSNATSPFGAASTGFTFSTPKSPTAEKKTTSSPFATASNTAFSFSAPKSPSAEKSTGSLFGAPSSITSNSDKSTTSPFATSGSGFSFGGPKSPTASKSTTSPFGSTGSSFSFSTSQTSTEKKSETTTTTSSFTSSNFSSFSATSGTSKPTTTPVFNFGVTPGITAAGAFGAVAGAASTLTSTKFSSPSGPSSVNPFAAITSMGLKKPEKKEENENEPEVVFVSDEEDDGEDGVEQDEDYTGDEDQYNEDEDDQHEGTGSYEGEGEEYSQEDSYEGEETNSGDEEKSADVTEDDEKIEVIQSATKPGSMFNFAPSSNPFGQAPSSSSLSTSIFSQPATVPKSPDFDFTFEPRNGTATTFSSGGFSGSGANKSRSTDNGDISDLEMSPVVAYYRDGNVDTDEGEISPLSSPVLGPQH